MIKNAKSSSLVVSTIMSIGLSLSAHAAVTSIPAGTTDFTGVLGEACLLYNLGGNFCSVQGDCGKNGHIDVGANAVGVPVGTGPMANANGFNTFGRYFGIVYGTKRMWLQVGPAGPNNCKVIDGAVSDEPINVGSKVATPPPSPERSDFRCGPAFGNASCGPNRCCSTASWCGGLKDPHCTSLHGYNGKFDGPRVSTPPAPPPLPACTAPIGSRVALRADTGKYLARCNGCQKSLNNSCPDTVSVHVASPTGSAIFTVVDAGNGRIALRADSGKYLARCYGCIIGAPPDMLTVHQASPYPFSIERVANGKCALKADTGNYVARCNNCSPGASVPDTVSINQTVATQSTAQFDLIILP